MKKYLCMLLIGTMLLGSSGCSPKTVDTGPTDGSQNVGTEVSGLTTAESKDEAQSGPGYPLGSLQPDCVVYMKNPDALLKCLKIRQCMSNTIIRN